MKHQDNSSSTKFGLTGQVYNHLQVVIYQTRYSKALDRLKHASVKLCIHVLIMAADAACLNPLCCLSISFLDGSSVTSFRHALIWAARSGGPSRRNLTMWLMQLQNTCWGKGAAKTISLKSILAPLSACMAAISTKIVTAKYLELERCWKALSQTCKCPIGCTWKQLDIQVQNEYLFF